MHPAAETCTRTFTRAMGLSPLRHTLSQIDSGGVGTSRVAQISPQCCQQFTLPILPSFRLFYSLNNILINILLEKVNLSLQSQIQMVHLKSENIGSS